MNRYRDAYTFMEDRFDLAEFKKAMNVTIQRKANIRNDHRKIAIGKAIISAASLAISVFLYWLISITFVQF